MEERTDKVFGVAKQAMRLDFVSKIITRVGKAAREGVSKEQGKFSSPANAAKFNRGDS